MDADSLDRVLITTITYLSNPLILPLILTHLRWITLRSGCFTTKDEYCGNTNTSGTVVTLGHAPARHLLWTESKYLGSCKIYLYFENVQYIALVGNDLPKS